MQPLRATLLSLYHERQLVRAVVQDRGTNEACRCFRRPACRTSAPHSCVSHLSALDSHTTIMRGLTVPLLEKINRETTAIVSNAECVLSCRRVRQGAVHRAPYQPHPRNLSPTRAQLEKNNFFPLLHVFDLVEQFEDLVCWLGAAPAGAACCAPAQPCSLTARPPSRRASVPFYRTPVPICPGATMPST